MPRQDRTDTIRSGDILCFVTLRNEAERLPHFLDHHRARGVGHFLIVDNDSTDDTAALLADAPDISVWTAKGSYRDARFGMDWLTGLMMRHGSGHWCLTLDADELLVHPHDDTRDLGDLTAYLGEIGQDALGAMMIELYPEGRLSATRYRPGDDPVAAMPWFDVGTYWPDPRPKFRVTGIRGGVRERMFFADAPHLSPHLHKTPLICWKGGYAYLSSTHMALPRRLNDRREPPGGARVSGALLHTKFLPSVVALSRSAAHRREHFVHTDRYTAYYDALAADPILHGSASARYEGWRHLDRLGLLSRGNWL